MSSDVTFVDTAAKLSPAVQAIGAGLGLGLHLMCLRGGLVTSGPIWIYWLINVVAQVSLHLHTRWVMHQKPQKIGLCLLFFEPARNIWSIWNNNYHIFQAFTFASVVQGSPTTLAAKSDFTVYVVILNFAAIVAMLILSSWADPPPTYTFLDSECCTGVMCCHMCRNEALF